MKKAFVFVFLIILGCKSEKIDTSIVEDFDLKIKQEMQLDGFKLSFDKVADSRCPINVQCFRAGEVVVDLSVNTDQKIQLCLGDCQVVQPSRKKGFVTQDTLEVTVNSRPYLFILKQVNPYPVTPIETKDNYEVKMQVIRR